MHSPTPEAQPNFAILKDCLSPPVIHRSAPKSSSGKRRRPKGRKSNVILSPSAVLDANTNDAEDLADFIDYIATEIFASFPSELQELSYTAIKNEERLAGIYTDPLPPSTISSLLASIPQCVTDSLEAYILLKDPSELPNLLVPILQDYTSASTTPPPNVPPPAKFAPGIGSP